MAPPNFASVLHLNTVLDSCIKDVLVGWNIYDFVAFWGFESDFV